MLAMIAGACMWHLITNNIMSTMSDDHDDSLIAWYHGARRLQVHLMSAGYYLSLNLSWHAQYRGLHAYQENVHNLQIIKTLVITDAMLLGLYAATTMQLPQHGGDRRRLSCSRLSPHTLLVGLAILGSSRS